MDPHANLAYSLVATAPSPATSGTSLVVTAGQGTRFPDPATVGAYNCTIWPAGAIPTPANAEIVRVTAKSTDTLTITRTQESTSARTVVVGDQIAMTVTKKTLTDAEKAMMTIRLSAHNDNVNGTMNVNSTSYIDIGAMNFNLDFSFIKYTHFRFVGRCNSTTAGQTITAQLAATGAPATPLSAGGDDLVIDSTNSYRTTAWIAIASPPSVDTNLMVAVKGSDGTVDLSCRFFDVQFKRDV